jgi:hypothetical protein
VYQSTITADEIQWLATELGYFDALHKIIEDHDITRETGARLKVLLFRHIMFQVNEAKKEVQKLQAVLGRLEAACRAGQVHKPAEGHEAYSASVSHLRGEMRAFDHWTAQLVDRNLSLLAAALNPEAAEARADELRETLAEASTTQPGNLQLDERDLGLSADRLERCPALAAA